MAIKAIVSSLDGLPPEIKNHYVQKDGKFVLDVETTDGYELANTKDLMSALGKERSTAAEAVKLLKAYGDIKPEDAKEAVTKVKEFATLDIDGKIKSGIEAREKELIKRHDTEKNELATKLARYSNGLHNQLVVNTLTAEIVAEGGNPHLLLPAVSRFVRVREDGDKFYEEVVDDQGTPRVGGTKDGVSVPMTAKQLVQEVKADARYAAAFSAGKSSGGGSDGNKKTAPSGVDLSQMSPVQRMEYARNKGG